MKLSIKSKLLLGFSVLMVFSIIIGLLGLRTSSGIMSNFQTVADKRLPETVLLEEINLNLANHRIWEVAFIMASTQHNTQMEADYLNKMQVEKDNLAQLMTKLDGMLIDEGERKLYQHLDEKLEKYYAVSEKLANLIKQDRIAEAISLIRSESRATYYEVGKSMDGLEKDIDDDIESMKNINSSSYSTSRNVNITLIVLSITLGLLTAFTISNSVAKGVKLVSEAATRIADGDLTINKLVVASKDEIADMAKAVNKMIDNLKILINKTNAAAQQVAATSEELSATTQETTAAVQQVARAMEELASGNTQQTESVNQTASAVEQLTGSISQIAKSSIDQNRNMNQASELVEQMARGIEEVAGNTQQVAQAAKTTSEAAKIGGKAIEETIDGMQAIKDSVFDTAVKIKELGDQSQQIGEIIQVIDDIAEQTNLLALNAAIEAARAGEHGKGFAVVADEVRKLAERSGKATKEIADLISSVQYGTINAVKAMEKGTAQVEKGVSLADNAGLALKNILETIHQANEQIESITAAIEQISAGSSEVVRAIDNVVVITKENSAATEQMAAGAKQVNSTMINIAGIAQESSATAEEISAATEEVNASIEEVSASAQTLSAMAQELKALVAQFQI